MRGRAWLALGAAVLAFHPSLSGARQMGAEIVIAADADALITASRRAADKLTALRESG